MGLSAAERTERIQLYARGSLRLRSALAMVPDRAVRWRPGPDRWSAHEVVCHCADAEVVAAARLRFLLAENEPVLAAFDQAEWARRFDYHAYPLGPALETVEAVRAHTTALLQRLPEESWARAGTHPEHGRYTVEDWLRIYADHLETHARQIDRNLEDWEASGPP